jgi:hypothetical protein
VERGVSSPNFILNKKPHLFRWGFSIYESKGGFEPRYGKLDVKTKK